jgi:hypothetical protein
MSEPIVVTWQYCRNGYDITGDFYAEQDADRLRAWDGDFCLIEVRRTSLGWEPSGGDGDWVRLADRAFANRGEALAAYMEDDLYVVAE